jgi:dihydroflavonol-4-reductase
MKNDALVLVTGGTGFVGSYLLRLLVREGWRVRALRRPGSPLDLVQDVAAQVDWAEADLCDVVALEDAFEGVTHVCHCAAMVSFHPRDRRRMMQVNVEGTANVVNLALDFGAKKLVHVSSIAAIGRSPERPDLDEQSKWVNSKANSQYAISKYLSEQEAWRGHFEGLPTAIVNPAIVLGSGFWDTGSARFFQQLDAGLPFWPTGRSGFVDVRDVAQFMLLLLESEVAGERFILNAQNMAYRDFFHLIASELGRKPPSIRVAPWLSEVAWRVEWLKEKLLGLAPVVTKESARSSVSQFRYANQKSLTMPGFAYRPLADTVRETAAQYLAAKSAGASASVLPA